jgi:DNA-binding SARP family transcriptional activator
MMQMYLECGQQVLAMRQYEACNRVLEAELGIRPTDETQVVYAQAMSMPEQHRVQSSVVREPFNLEQVQKHLHLAIKNLNELRLHLHQVSELIHMSQSNGFDASRDTE